MNGMLFFEGLHLLFVIVFKMISTSRMITVPCPSCLFVSVLLYFDLRFHGNKQICYCHSLTVCDKMKCHKLFIPYSFFLDPSCLWTFLSINFNSFIHLNVSLMNFFTNERMKIMESWSSSLWRSWATGQRLL